MHFWGPCDLHARGQGSEEAARHAGEKEGGAHGGGEHFGGLGVAQGLPWVDSLRGGLSLGRWLVSFPGGGRSFCGEVGG